MINILHVVPSFGLGGMEKVMCAVINATNTTYTHAILSLDNNTAAVTWIKDSKITLLHCTKSERRLRFFHSLYQLLSQRRPRVLMTYNWGATDAIWLGRLCGIQHIIHNEHGFNMDEALGSAWKRDVVRWLVYHLASTTVVVSRELSDTMRQRFALSAKQVTWIPNGINARHYVQNLAARKTMRDALGMQDTDFVIGFSGRLDPVKNFDLMLRVFRLCLESDAHCKFLIIGDGPEKNRLTALCTTLGLHEQVLLVGQQEEVLPYLRALDAFVLTSHSEQLPMTILEAMAVGLPIVASRVGGIPSLIDDGQNGFLLSPQAEPAAWAERLLALKHQTVSSGLGLSARQKTLDKFQEETMVKSYNVLLQRVIGG